MKTIKNILKWYIIGVIVSAFFVTMLILVENLKVSQVHEYHNIPQIIFGFVVFAGIVAYAGFGSKNYE